MIWWLVAGGLTGIKPISNNFCRLGERRERERPGVGIFFCIAGIVPPIGQETAVQSITEVLEVLDTYSTTSRYRGYRLINASSHLQNRVLEVSSRFAGNVPLAISWVQAKRR